MLAVPSAVVTVLLTLLLLAHRTWLTFAVLSVVEIKGSLLCPQDRRERHPADEPPRSLSVPPPKVQAAVFPVQDISIGETGSPRILAH